MKRILLSLMRNGGLFAVSRATSSRMGRILMYHNFSRKADTSAVSVALIREQLTYLGRNFRVVPLAHIVEQVRSRQPLDRGLVALTIDDGRRNCYEFLFPLLKEFNLPATFFVVSSFIRGEDWIWTDKVQWLSEQLHRSDELASENIDAFFRMLNQMPPEVRNRRIEGLATSMNVVIPKHAPPKYAPCSWNQLREMADSGLVEIGSHTVTHPILASTNDEESWQELTLSRAQIEEGVGQEVDSFCFPNGKPGDYRLSQVRMLKDAGYSSAVVARFGMVCPMDDVFELPRIGIAGGTDPLIFAKYLDGVEYYQARLQRALGLRWLSE